MTSGTSGTSDRLLSSGSSAKQIGWKKTRKRNKKVGLNMMLGTQSILRMTNIFHLDINKCSNEFQLDAIQRAISVKQELNKEEMKGSPTFPEQYKLSNKEKKFLQYSVDDLPYFLDILPKEIVRNTGPNSKTVSFNIDSPEQQNKLLSIKSTDVNFMLAFCVDIKPSQLFL